MCELAGLKLAGQTRGFVDISDRDLLAIDGSLLLLNREHLELMVVNTMTWSITLPN